ncbi:beta-1,4-galactosyltransferase 1-like [Oppia nitens]|uniref:beta-1,4-galactosyltransferase 1-like n=1 Tax=Oppia nitens TaxID=1686743 RepID=UPI0023DB99CE|nr:beta-1,4-galactosyltransferase 1-like [Oppia nitens]
MKIFRLKVLVRDLRLTVCEISLLIFLFWATVWPIVFPNWMSGQTKQVSDNDIISDIEICSHDSNFTADDRPDCPLMAPNLVSYFDVLTKIDNQLIESIAAKYDIRIGGRREPRHCRSGQQVAIVVPFRNRWTHLSLFLQHMHRFLSEQLIDYTIFIVEQNDTKAFNRGKLFNIGFVESNKLQSFCCFIFHDIDVLPMNQKQLYYCSHTPRHVCSHLDKFRFVLIYPNLIGGVVAITKSHYQSVNGYSNGFEGWGAEDDDFYNRIQAKSLILTRWSPHISRCIMLKHKRQKPNPNRKSLLESGKSLYDTDGLNSLDDTYKVVAINFQPLYTLIKVQL